MRYQSAPIVTLILAAATLVQAGEIHDAASSGDAQKVQQLLAANANLALARDDTGRTPLQVAVARDDGNVALVLLTRSSCAYTDGFLDARTERGALAKRDGSLARAHDTLKRLLRSDPANASINFAYGLTCLSLEDYPRAGLAFERVLDIDPGNSRARLELAHTHMAAGRVALAGGELREALDENPPEGVRRNIEAQLAMIEAAKRRWRFTARLDAGYVHDDNVNVGPDSDVINIEPLTLGSQTFTALSLAEGSRPMKDDGLFGYVGLAGEYDAGEPGGWGAMAEASWYQNWLDDARDHESMFLQGTLGMQRRGPVSLLRLPLAAAHIASGHDSLVNLYGAAPSLLYAPGNGKLSWLTAATLEYRDYVDLDARDGAYVLFGETMRRFLGNAGHNIQAGVALFYNFADADVYAHSGAMVKLGGDLVLPWETLLYSRARYTWSSYRERELLASEKRSDGQFQCVVGLNKTLAGKWGLNLNYQYTDNNSSFGLYEYERNVATVSTFCTF